MSADVTRNGIPPNAKRVFQGEIFEVWQWEQKMFDGTTQTFEKIWRPSTTEVIATVGNRILIEEQDQPDRKNNVNLPGGRMDRDDPLGEAKRELLEETGYASDEWQPFAMYGGNGKVIHVSHYFVAHDCKKVQEPELDAGEKITTKLISFDDLIALSDDPRFWTSPEFVNYLFRVRLDPKLKAEFRKTLFP